MLKWCIDVLLTVKQKITKVLIVYILMHEHISDNCLNVFWFELSSCRDHDRSANLFITQSQSINSEWKVVKFWNVLRMYHGTGEMAQPLKGRLITKNITVWFPFQSLKKKNTEYYNLHHTFKYSSFSCLISFRLWFWSVLVLLKVFCFWWKTSYKYKWKTV